MHGIKTIWIGAELVTHLNVDGCFLVLLQIFPNGRESNVGHGWTQSVGVGLKVVGYLWYFHYSRFQVFIFQTAS